MKSTMHQGKEMLGEYCQGTVRAMADRLQGLYSTRKVDRQCKKILLNV